MHAATLLLQTYTFTFHHISSAIMKFELNENTNEISILHCICFHLSEHVGIFSIFYRSFVIVHSIQTLLPTANHHTSSLNLQHQNRNTITLRMLQLHFTHSYTNNSSSLQHHISPSTCRRITHITCTRSTSHTCIIAQQPHLHSSSSSQYLHKLTTITHSYTK